MDEQIKNQGGNSQEVQFEKDSKAVSAIESRAEQRQAAEQEAKERTAIEGAKQLVEATSMALSASYSDDYQARSAETEQARRLEADAYKKLAAVDVAQANALVAAERNSVGDDGQLKASIRLDETKFAAAVREHNAEADKAMAIADIGNFKEIQNPALQEHAAVQMADNIRNYPDYKTALETAEPGITEKVAALNAANTEKVMAKEERKAAEYAAMVQERQDTAKAWTPEEAAKHAQQDVAALERVAAARARDSALAREALGLNSIEPGFEKQQQKLSEEEDAKRSAWLKKAQDAQPVANEKAAPGGNKVESDEIFTATQEEVKPVVPPDIEKQYLRVGDKFYHPKNTDLVAFEDKGNKLETKSNSEAIAESMVRIAEARGWDEIKVTGSEAFRKEVWLEAASRGMHVKGYSPSEQDKAELAKRSANVEANKIEQDNKPFRARENEADKPAPQATAPKAEAKPEPEKSKAEPEKPESSNKRMAQVFANETAAEAVKKHPELAGAAAAVAAMDKKAEADGLTPEQRAIVAARVRQNVINSIERGDLPEVKVKEEVEVKRENEKEITR